MNKKIFLIICILVIAILFIIFAKKNKISNNNDVIDSITNIHIDETENEETDFDYDIDDSEKNDVYIDTVTGKAVNPITGEILE